ncbi:MAG: hypothetical protein KDH08_18595 [Anaerolineae bacterium]|nr:hypothetical protein [Anaerolineae bacterium]
MPSTPEALSWTIAIEMDYLVSRQCWYGGLKDKIGGLITPEPTTWDQAIDKHFEEQKTPVFLDRWFTADALLGEVILASSASKLSIQGGIQSTAWMADYLVLRVYFRFTDPIVQKVEVKELHDQIHFQASMFDANISSATADPPIQLCQWTFIVDETLKGVGNQAEVLEWCKQDLMRGLDDAYSAFDPVTSVIMVGPTDEPKYYRWYFSQLPGSKPPFANAEFHAAIRYQATRYLFHQINVDAEAEMDRLRNTNLATEASLKTTGFMRLLASLSPWYHDPTAELGELIEEINNGIQSMYTRLRRLEVLYDFFKIDAEWKSGFFTLTRPRYRGGPLVDKDWRDAGKLTLADYYRRSALAVEDFYRKKYVGSIEELEAKQNYLQTRSAVRNERQTSTLNKLVLVLTLVSAGLAALQVLGLPDGWNDERLLFFALGFIGIMIIAVAAANVYAAKKQ